MPVTFEPTNPVVVGSTAKANQYARVFNNTLANHEGQIAIAGQAEGSIVIAASATQLGVVANAYGVVKADGAGAVTIGPASNLRCDQEAAGRLVAPVGADKWAT